MLPDRVSNPGPQIYESGALPIALRGPAPDKAKVTVCSIMKLATIAFDETSSYWSAPKSS